MPLKETSNQKIPTRGLMYGDQGVGKTTWALGAPEVLAIDPTGRLAKYKKRMDFVHWEATSLADIDEALRGDYPEFDGCETIVVDELGAIQQMVWTELCAANGWRDIKAPGWGDGFEAAAQRISDLLSALERTGKDVILTCHADVDRRRINPLGQDYARYDLALHKGVKQRLWQWSDFQLLMRVPVDVAEIKDPKSGQVKTIGMAADTTPVINTQEAPGWAAKNCFHCKAELSRGNDPSKSYAEFGHYVAARSLDMDELRAEVSEHEAFREDLREDQLTQLYVHIQMTKEKAA